MVFNQIEMIEMSNLLLPNQCIMFVNRTLDLPVSESYTLATAAMSGLSYPQSVVGRGQHHPIVNKTDLSGMNELTDFLPIRSNVQRLAKAGAPG